MIFMTGFPGFIGEQLAAELQAAEPRASFLFLVQQKFRALAEERAKALTSARILTGDITQPGLGLPPEDFPEREAIRQVWHLAALYDLAAGRELSRKINVAGTRHVIDFCATLPALERLFHVSTCYVSGTTTGTFAEEDLDRGQSFLNEYEWGKFESEKIVREAMSSGLPATVFRPAIVVGDSRTGTTAKFDGPYFIMESMKRMPPWSVFLKIGSGSAEANIVPVDFVIRAMSVLSRMPGSSGRTYQIADPAPRSAFEVEREMARLLGRHFLYVPVSLSMARRLLSPRFLQKALGMPAASLPYFDHPVHYSTSNCERDLQGTGVACPKLVDYLPTVVDFFLRNRKRVRKEAMA